MNQNTRIADVARLLSSYPFSVAGYSDYDRQLKEFFGRLGKSTVVNSLEFVFGLLAEPDERAFYEDGQWKTKPLDSLLFWASDNDVFQWSLPFYLSLLRHLAGHTEITATNALANTLVGDVDVIVKPLTATAENSLAIGRNTLRNDQITLHLPCSILVPNSEMKRSPQETVRAAADQLRGHAPIPMDGVHYRLNSPEMEGYVTRAKPVFNTLFQPSELKKVSSDLEREITKREGGQVFRRGLSRQQRADLVSSAIASSVLATCYGIDIRYVFPPCFVSRGRYHSAGGLAIGIPSSTSLHQDEFAAIYLLASHLVSNLAAQVSNSRFVEARGRRAHSFVKQFASGEGPGHTLLHFPHPNEKTELLAQSALKQFRKVAPVLSDKTTNEITKYLGDLCTSDADKSQIRDSFESVRDIIIYESRHVLELLQERMSLFSERGFRCTLNAPHVDQLPRTKLYGDWRWIASLIKAACDNVIRHTEPKSSVDHPAVELELRFDDKPADASAPARFKKLTVVVRDSGPGCDVSTIITTGSTWKSALGDPRVLREHGDLYIESKQRRLDALCLGETTPGITEQGTTVMLSLDLQ